VTDDDQRRQLDDLQAFAAEHADRLRVGGRDGRGGMALLEPVLLQVKRGLDDPTTEADGRTVSLRIASYAMTEEGRSIDIAVMIEYAALVALIANPDDTDWDDGG
jgi:hypothetical protein